MKKTPIAIAVASLFAINGIANAAPEGGNVVAGQASIQQKSGNTSIEQSSQRAIINWNSFNIGVGERVQHNMPGANSHGLHRVTGGNGASQLAGELKSNGNVYLVNPAGVVIHQGARIDVGGFLATTHNITDDNFMAGKLRFDQPGQPGAVIVNLGQISVRDSGFAALVAPSVRNDGIIAARLGRIALSSGGAYALDLHGDDLISFTASEALVDSLYTQEGEPLGVTNNGQIKAEGGVVLLTASQLDGIVQSVVNNGGTISAASATLDGGKIILHAGAGTLNVSGTLDASAQNGGDGGFIETSGGTVNIADTARITTAAQEGKTGEWLIDPNDYTIAASGGNITGAALSNNLASNNVTIQTNTMGTTGGNGDIFVNDAVSWNQNTLTLIAERDININAVMTASGTSKLTLNTGANGTDANLNVGFAPGEAKGFAGRVDFPGRSGMGFLRINEQDYFVINSLGAEGSATGADLQGINGNLNGLYALGGDIDASATAGWNGGAGFEPISFSGTFDGLGHAIGNLTINRPNETYVGLFGDVISTHLRNVGLENVSVTGENHVGGLLGSSLADTTITNAYATGTVTGNITVGGLVGYGGDDAITNAYAAGVVAGGSEVGGLVGVGFRASITNAYATGAVTGHSDYVGGLVGRGDSATITNAYATGAVTGSTGHSDYVGGLVGSGYLATITNAYATGAVTGYVGAFNYSSNVVGGLVGYGYSATITNAYATGAVTGFSYVGGLVGSGYLATITNAYATGAVTAISSAGGLVGDGSLATITNAYATGAVMGESDVGGLVGAGGCATITNAYATGAVTSNFNRVGGLVGAGGGATITNAYATGAVTGGSEVGGLVGGGYLATITNAYAAGEVMGGFYVGGLVGWNGSLATISNSFWNTETTGKATSSGGGIGLTTAQMQDPANFAAWDIGGENSVWIMGGNGIPVLRPFPEITLAQNTHPATANNPNPPGYQPYPSQPPAFTPEQQAWLDAHPNPSVADLLVAVGSGLFVNGPQDPVWSYLYVGGKATQNQINANAYQPAYDQYKNASVAILLSALYINGALNQDIWAALGISNKANRDAAYAQFKTQQTWLGAHPNPSVADLLVAVGSGLFVNGPQDPVWSYLYVGGKATQNQINANAYQPAYDQYKNASVASLLSALKNTSSSLYINGALNQDIWAALGISNKTNRDAAYAQFKGQPEEPEKLTLTQAQQNLINTYRNANAAQLLDALNRGLFAASSDDLVWQGLFVNGKASNDQNNAASTLSLYNNIVVRQANGSVNYEATIKRIVEELTDGNLPGKNGSYALVWKALAITNEPLRNEAMDRYNGANKAQTDITKTDKEVLPNPPSPPPQPHEITYLLDRNVYEQTIQGKVVGALGDFPGDFEIHGVNIKNLLADLFWATYSQDQTNSAGLKIDVDGDDVKANAIVKKAEHDIQEANEKAQAINNSITNKPWYIDLVNSFKKSAWMMLDVAKITWSSKGEFLNLVTGGGIEKIKTAADIKRLLTVLEVADDVEQAKRDAIQIVDSVSSMAGLLGGSVKNGKIEGETIFQILRESAILIDAANDLIKIYKQADATPPDNILALIASVAELSKKYDQYKDAQKAINALKDNDMGALAYTIEQQLLSDMAASAFSLIGNGLNLAGLGAEASIFNIAGAAINTNSNFREIIQIHQDMTANALAYSKVQYDIASQATKDLQNLGYYQ